MTSVLKRLELAVCTDDAPDAEELVLSKVLDRGVSVHAACSYSTGDRAIVAFIAEDALEAKKAVEAAGFNCKINSVVFVSLDNRVGAVAELGSQLQRAGIEISRSYVTRAEDDRMTAVFKTNDDARALRVLLDNLQANPQAHVQHAA